MENKPKRKERIRKSLKRLLWLVLNPRFLLCFGLAWIITNGWAYILLGVGIWTEIGWMSAVASAYLAFLWVPGTPEKIVTLAIALFLLRHLFPKDEKTLGLLREWHMRAKDSVNAKRKERKERKKKTDEE